MLRAAMPRCTSRNHLIGLELNISILSAALRNEPTGQPHDFRGDVAAVAKRNLRAGEMLDGEGGYTVWGKLMPAQKSLAAGALPIGLAHRVKLKSNVAHGAVVRWTMSRSTKTATSSRREGDGCGVRRAALVYGNSRFARAWANHLRNITSVSIISVKPGLVDLNGRDDRGRPRLGLAVAHAVIGILE